MLDLKLLEGRWASAGQSMVRGRAYTREGAALASVAAAVSAREVCHWTGSFAAVASSGDTLTLITDPARSIPLFWRFDGDRLLAGDDIAAIAHGAAPDADSLVEFANMGFVSGADTLHEGVRSVPSGHVVRINLRDKSVVFEPTNQVVYTPGGLEDWDSIDAAFDGAMEATFGRLLEWAGDRQLVVPLSGGLDSRLVSAWLKKAGATRVVNFTYGVSGSPESRVSRAVSQALGQQWEFIDYDAAEIRRQWAQPEAARFIEYAYAGGSLPHIQDWYALKQMREHGILEPGAVFLPGHTIVGGFHDQWVIEREGMGAGEMAQVLVRYHGSAQGNPGALASNSRFISKVGAFLHGIDFGDDPLVRARAVESFNMCERQAKYINNSMRGYEFFGFEWALPMLEREFWDIWQLFSPNVNRNRDWYERYVGRLYESQGGPATQYYAPTAVPAGRREQIKSVLRATGLLTLAQRAAAARATAYHDMAFEGFTAGLSRAQVAGRIMRGWNILGIYSDLMLKHQWNQHTSIP